MGEVILLVTWIVSGQPAASYQATFDSMAACEAAKTAVGLDQERLAAASQKTPAWVQPGMVYNPGPAPLVSAVCTPKG